MNGRRSLNPAIEYGPHVMIGNPEQTSLQTLSTPPHTLQAPSGMPRLASGVLSSFSPSLLLSRLSTMATSVPILAFNDVYRVQQRYVPQPGCPDPPNAFPPDAEIKVGQFAQLVYDLRAQWPLRKPGLAEGGSDDDGRDGLFLFAGDVFSPSVESSVTRGSHMVSTSRWRAGRAESRGPLHPVAFIALDVFPHY